MTFYIIVILYFILFLGPIGIPYNDPAFGKKDNSSSQKNIEICYTWGDSIKDDELPFSTWSVRVLAGFIMKDMKLIEKSYRDKKYFVKTWNQMETVKNCIGS